jgi:hypothetical protein
MEALFAAISDEFDILTGFIAPGTKLAPLVRSLQTLINRVCQLVSRQPVLLEECGQLIRSLRIARYWGDYGL